MRVGQGIIQSVVGDASASPPCRIERSLSERGLKPTLTMFGEIFRRRVADHPERIGCPVAAAALRDEGVGAKEAETFAGLVISTIEGALLRARAAGSQAPLDSAISGLQQALDSLLDAGR